MKFRFIFIIVAALITISCNQERFEETKPNILFIMSDDHGYQAISAYDNSLIQTPNIDKLANSGVRFENSFVTNSICAPSRAVLLTGAYSHVNGLIDNYRTFDTSQIVFPEILQGVGYETAMIGKWHLKSEPEGFDYWNILPGQGHYYNPDFIDNGVRKQITGYVTDITTDIALEWLDNRDSSKPFCLMLHHKAPHRNWMPARRHLNIFDSIDFPIPESFYDDYSGRGSAARDQEMEIGRHMMMAYDLKNPYYYNGNSVEHGDINNWNAIYSRLNVEQKEFWEKAYAEKGSVINNTNASEDDVLRWKYQRYMQDYLACIASVDENVGRVVKYLENNNLRENTIIVYTSDQGFYLGEHGWFDKRFMYEQSLRMPLIISYPNRIKPNVDKANLVLNLDFAPTFLDFAGAEIPERFQGESLKEILIGESPDPLRDAIYYRYYEFPSVHMVQRHYGIRTNRYKLIHFYYDDNYWELYDLQEDPQELNNIYNNEENKPLIDKLKKRLHELQVQYGDDNGDQFLPAELKKTDHLGIGAKISLKNSFSSRYMAGGENALIDGLYVENGNSEYGYKGWQGFEYNDMVATIDLGEETGVSKIKIGFLHKPGAWIFGPEKVSVQFSRNGKDFDDFSSQSFNSTDKKTKDGKLEVVFDIANDYRYLRVAASNVGSCPDWHKAAGKNAWLMADEIIIE